MSDPDVVPTIVERLKKRARRYSSSTQDVNRSVRRDLPSLPLPASLPLFSPTLLSTHSTLHTPLSPQNINTMMLAPLSPLFLFVASRSSKIVSRQRSLIIGCSSSGLKMSSSSSFQKATNQHKPSPMAGMPISPVTMHSKEKPIILRYMYEGGSIGQGRLCNLVTNDDDDEKVVTAKQIVDALIEDGVDFDTFYASAYESDESFGGWRPLESAPRYINPFTKSAESNHNNEQVVFNIPSEDENIARRIDIKLFRRPRVPELRETVETIDSLDIDKLLNVNDTNSDTKEYSSDALMAIDAAVPGGKMDIDGFFGIGIISPKTEQNVGTLWRSAYQLGASVLYTIGGRYKSSSSDTLNVPARIPLIELDDWNSFAEWAAPKAAVWVAIEMGGTPLSEFKHPRNAIYILGSEDHGVPKSVLRGCREVVSLESEQYGSYNVAVAGSLVMYDRMMKQKKTQKTGKGRKGNT